MHGGADKSGRPKGSFAITKLKSIKKLVDYPSDAVTVTDSVLRRVRDMNPDEVIKAIYHIKQAYKYYVAGAKKRNIHFGLTYEEFASFAGEPCIYCADTELSGVRLDRLNNDKKVGYVMGNVAQCCWPCNRMKGSLSHEEFLQRCNTVTNISNKTDKLKAYVKAS